MWPPRDITLNALLHLQIGRRLARRSHHTGVMVDPGAAAAAFDLLSGGTPTALTSQRILEIGPGRGMELMRRATEHGADYAAFDVVNYLGTAPVAHFGVDYRIDPTGRLPWPDATFDRVWSYSVLEHIPAPLATLVDIHRVLKPGGQTVSLIDLETHAGGRGDPKKMYEFLRYPEWLWNAMTSRRSIYVNRFRVSEWRELFARAGLRVAAEEQVHAVCGLRPLREVPYLAALSDEDVLTRRVTFTAVRDAIDQGIAT